MQIKKRHIAILGSTGSIGRQALDVISNHSDRFEAYALVANNSVELLIQQARTFMPEIVVIANEGHTEQVMDAARSAGAMGGTVLHAKGTGAEKAKKFYGVSLIDEKEMILIVAKASEKAGIMHNIIKEAGWNSPAGAVTFSLPVSDVAGLSTL